MREDRSVRPVRLRLAATSPRRSPCWLCLTKHAPRRQAMRGRSRAGAVQKAEGTGLEPVSAFLRGGFQVRRGALNRVRRRCTALARGQGIPAAHLTRLHRTGARCCQLCCQPTAEIVSGKDRVLCFDPGAHNLPLRRILEPSVTRRPNRPRSRSRIGALRPQVARKPTPT
jgi:hypothetical protein